MHRIFRKALDTATGKSQFIIAVVVDIRDFSSFSQTRESPDTAVFLKRVYTKLIDHYFPFADFYKSTGDGLLITIPFNEETLQETCQKVIDSCFRCHDEFENICKGDPMVNFEVPKRVGIGIARGTVCRLVSKKRILDYSGRLLNLTSRLTDLARPSGIVIDGTFGIDLLSEVQKAELEKEAVYIRGIAEAEPIEVFITKKHTEVPATNKTPFSKITWKTVEETKTLGLIQKTTGYFIHRLPSIPSDPRKINVKIEYPKFKHGKRVQGIMCGEDFKAFNYTLDAGKPIVRINYAQISNSLLSESIPKRTRVNIKIFYPEIE